MEAESTTTHQEQHENHWFNFSGTGRDLFMIRLVNLIFSILTLGLYYPWAKAKVLKYLYSETHLNQEPFKFHGTGKEMFKGFIKVIFFVLFLYFLPTIAQLSGASESIILLCTLITFVGFLLLVPLAVHGTMRYRMSRSSYRGIHFGYRGSLKELYSLFFKYGFLTIITLGIYVPWMTVKLREYVVSNIRYGDKEFEFSAEGQQLFIINLKFGAISMAVFYVFYLTALKSLMLASGTPSAGAGVGFFVGYLIFLLSIMIVQAFYRKEVFEFNFENMMILDERHHNFYVLLENREVAMFLLKNVPLLVVTFGIAWPWVQTNLLKMVFYNLQIDGSLSLDNAAQTEPEYKDAAGEDLGDFLDLDFI